MLFTRHAVSLVVAASAAVMGADAFSPLAPQGSNHNLNNIAQVVKDSQRFQNVVPQVGGSPTALSADDEEDDFLSTDDIDSPPAEDYIVNLGDLDDDEDGEVDEEYDGEPPAWYTSQQRMEELRAQFRRHETDTGSPEYQVAGMTERISYLTGHLQVHPKDFSTRRGLVALVNKRRRLLNYLFREDEDRYAQIISSLGIRHKAPGRVRSREEQYNRFPKQKAIKKHLVKNKKRK